MDPRPRQLERALALHASSSRLRLRVPTRRNDAVWFNDTAHRLRAQPGITAVRCSPAIATLTIGLASPHQGPRADPRQALQRAGLDARLTHRAMDAEHRHGSAHGPLHGAEPEPPEDRSQSVAWAQGPGLLQPTRIDRRKLALAVFLLLLLRHLWRSGWLLPGLALAWFLMESLPSLRLHLPSLRRTPADPRHV